MAMAWKQMFSHRSTRPDSLIGFFRFFSKPSQYVEKVGIPEFLNGVGKGVETHVAKLETEIGDFNKLLVTRTLRLKKLGIPCKHVVVLFLYLSKFQHKEENYCEALTVMVLSLDLQAFILRSRVLKLYRQGLRISRRAPSHSKVELRQEIRQELEKNRQNPLSD